MENEMNGKVNFEKIVKGNKFKLKDSTEEDIRRKKKLNKPRKGKKFEF